MVKYNSFKNNYILKFLIFYIYIYALLILFYFIYFIIRGALRSIHISAWNAKWFPSITWNLEPVTPPPRNIPPGLTCNIRGSHKFPVQLWCTKREQSILYTKKIFKVSNSKPSSLYFTTSKVARRLDIMTGHSPFSSYSAKSPLDKSTFSNLVPSSYKIQLAFIRKQEKQAENL